MALLSPRLPPEVWVHVFGYLSTADKLNISTCCKYFKKLVDHGSLWKDYTLALSFRNGNSLHYNPQFWATLHSRRIQSVRMQQYVALSLPTLSDKGLLNFLKKFPYLKRLAVASVKMNFDSRMSLPQQLTHLSLCNVCFLDETNLISAISQLTNLTSLAYHPDAKNYIPFKTFHSTIARLPKLKHLSWLMHPAEHAVSQGGENGFQFDGLALSSLELILYDDRSLSKYTMRSLPGLQSLTLFYMEHFVYGCHLKTWLSDLSRLSTLVIVKGPALDRYADSIPATVTRLTLRMAHQLEDFALVAKRVPGLLHLHLDPLWPWSRIAGYWQIPQLVPQLRSLTIRHQGVPEKDFLGLQSLPHLERLEFLDVRPKEFPRLYELIRKLHALTNQRIHIVTSARKSDPLATCSCTDRRLRRVFL